MVVARNQGILTSLEYNFINMMSASRSLARSMSTGDGAATRSARCRQGRGDGGRDGGSCGSLSSSLSSLLSGVLFLKADLSSSRSMPY